MRKLTMAIFGFIMCTSAMVANAYTIWNLTPYCSTVKPNMFSTNYGTTGTISNQRRDGSNYKVDVTFQMGMYCEAYAWKSGVQLERVPSIKNFDNLKTTLWNAVRKESGATESTQVTVNRLNPEVWGVTTTSPDGWYSITGTRSYSSLAGNPDSFQLTSTNTACKDQSPPTVRSDLPCGSYIYSGWTAKIVLTSSRPFKSGTFNQNIEYELFDQNLQTPAKPTTSTVAADLYKAVLIPDSYSNTATTSVTGTIDQNAATCSVTLPTNLALSNSQYMHDPYDVHYYKATVTGDPIRVVRGNATTLNLALDSATAIQSFDSLVPTLYVRLTKSTGEHVDLNTSDASSQSITLSGDATYNITQIAAESTSGFKRFNTSSIRLRASCN